MAPKLKYRYPSDSCQTISLHETKLILVICLIPQVKTDFEATMVWGKSFMENGTSPDVEPCAKPGCTPFPSCCRTDTVLRPDMSRYIP